MKNRLVLFLLTIVFGFFTLAVTACSGGSGVSQESAGSAETEQPSGEEGGGGGDGPPSLPDPTPDVTKQVSINDFSFSSDIALPEDRVTLSWDIEGVDSLEIIPHIGTIEVEGDRAKGSIELPPLSKTTTFTMVAKRGDREIKVNRTISILTEGKDLAIDLFSCPLKALPKQEFKINYSVKGASDIRLVEGRHQEKLTSRKGDLQRTITSNTTYTINASNPGGAVSASCTVIARNAHCMLQDDCRSNPGIAGGMSSPDGVCVAGSTGPLVVADWFNSRVLIWDKLPESDGVIADHVLGQPSLNQNAQTSPTFHEISPKNFGRVDNVLCSTELQGLVVTDPDRHRVMYWKNIPTRDNMPADVILGHSNGHDSSEEYLRYPTGAHFMDGQLFIVDHKGGGRISIWNDFPASVGTGKVPDISFDDIPLANGGGRSRLGGNSSYRLNSSGDVTDYKDYLIVVDPMNHRVVFINRFKSDDEGNKTARTTQADWDDLTPADVFCFPNSDCTPSTLEPVDHTTVNAPLTAFVGSLNVDGNDGVLKPYLVISDLYLARMIAYPIDPDNFGNADAGYGIDTRDPNNVVLIGQREFDDAENSHGDPTLIDPNFIAPIEGGGFVITSRDCSRALIYNTSEEPLLSGEGADQRGGSHILGHDNMEGCGQNTYGTKPSASDMMWAGDIAFDGKRYYFADKYRVLIYNEFPLSPHQEAIGVIGQRDFESNQKNMGGEPDADTLGYATKLYATPDKLFVSDQGNCRILVYDLTNFKEKGMRASWVIGQPNFNEAMCVDEQTASNLYYTSGIHYDGKYIYAGNYNGYRILVFDAEEVFSNKNSPPIAKAVIGQKDFTSRRTGAYRWAFDITYNDGDLYTADLSTSRVYINKDIHKKIDDWLAGRIDIIEPDVTLYRPVERDEDGAVIKQYLPFKYCQTLDVAQGKLFVADRQHNRVLIYDLADLTRNDAMPSYLYGQWDADGKPTLETGIQGLSIAGVNSLDHTALHRPGSISVIGDFLIIGDARQRRQIILPLDYVLEVGRLR